MRYTCRHFHTTINHPPINNHYVNIFLMFHICNCKVHHPHQHHLNLGHCFYGINLKKCWCILQNVWVYCMTCTSLYLTDTKNRLFTTTELVEWIEIKHRVLILWSQQLWLLHIGCVCKFTLSTPISEHSGLNVPQNRITDTFTNAPIIAFYHKDISEYNNL